jgi:hypothetical protein
MQKGHDYILSKQIQWAKRKNIKLIGSKVTKGFPAYTQKLDDNLFEPLVSDVINDLSKGDGGEILSKNNFPAKANAVHSSSALGINMFHYWKTSGKIDNIAHACGLCAKQNKMQTDIRFEQKFIISKTFQKCPNLDVVIENNENDQYKIYAIECKFSEAYSPRKHGGIDPKYFRSDIMPLWNDISNIYDLAKTISPDDNEFKFLHPGQLIKHILGLKNKFGKKDFRLLYLWYDVLGKEGYVHRTEIEKFSAYTNADEVKFSSISYQELITSLAKNYYETNEKFIDYMTGRYL